MGGITQQNKLAFINLADYCKIDGTDDSTGFTTAYTLASTLGMGLRMPGGTLVKGNDTLLPNVSIDLGGGTIKLKNGANTDLFSAQTSSINLAAASGSGIIGTLSNFSITNGVLDGNKANQTGGPSWCLRFYGYKYILRDLSIRNGYSGGILSDWNGGAEIVPFTAEQMEATLDNLYIHSHNGIGLQMGGPHDSRLSNITSYDNSSHGFHFAPNMLGVLCTQIHPYQLHTGAGAVGVLCETGSANFANCMFEGSDTAQLALLASDCSVTGGEIFGNVGSAGTGLQLGQQAGQTPIVGQVLQSGGVTTAVSVSGSRIATSFRNCTAGGAINEANVGILNTYLGDIYQTSGSAIASNSGYLSSTSTAMLSVQGLTADGTPGKGGIFQIGNGSDHGFTVFDTSGAEIFDINTYLSLLAILNGKQLAGYSDAGSTNTYSIHADTGNIETMGRFATGQSATAPDPGAGGTVTTTNIGVARVSPAASRTGCILAVGATAGQETWVVNESASNSISWATQATSHIAGEAGGTFVLAANHGQKFVWNSSVSLWFKSS